METTRQQKIAKQIQKDVAEIFQKEGAPIVRGSLVTVTAVRISPDFSYAKIYVSIFPFEQSGEVMKRLEHQNWFIRRWLPRPGPAAPQPAEERPRNSVPARRFARIHRAYRAGVERRLTVMRFCRLFPLPAAAFASPIRPRTSAEAGASGFTL